MSLSISVPLSIVATHIRCYHHPAMRFDAELIDARFIQRLNRFAALVDLDGREVMAHVANTGRMTELLTPDRPVLLRPAAKPGRKTAFDLMLVDLGFALCSTDSRLPPRLVKEAFLERRLDPFAGYHEARREVIFEESRFDLMLTGKAGVCYVETKSVNLVEDRVALFPDAPTERGVKHLGTLVKAVQAGHRAAAFFVIQRPDAEAFRPHQTADPTFANALRDSVSQGVEVYAYNCRVTRRSILHPPQNIRLRLE